MIPDGCVVTVNYRFARTDPGGGVRHVKAVRRLQVRLTDGAPGARPGLDHPAAATFVAAMGDTPRAKLGWTDVRFSMLGMPAVNCGPGDPNLAHPSGAREPGEVGLR